MLGLFFIGADSVTRGRRRPARPALGIAVAIAAGFLLVRRGAGRRGRAAHPDRPLPQPGLRAVGRASICAFAAFTIAFVALPFYFQSVLGLDQVATGLLMTPWPVALGLAAPLAGRLSDRRPGRHARRVRHAAPRRRPRAPRASPAGDRTRRASWRMALCGFGFGFFQAPNNRTMLAAAPRARSGAAGGMLATARLLGMTVGRDDRRADLPSRAGGGGSRSASGSARGSGVAAALLSGLRLSRRDGQGSRGEGLSGRACWQGR